MNTFVGFRVVLLPWRQDDDGSKEARTELRHVVHMGVIDESPGSRRTEINLERLARFNHRNDLLVVAGPTWNAIVVTLELDPMPVN